MKKPILWIFFSMTFFLALTGAFGDDNERYGNEDSDNMRELALKYNSMGQSCDAREDYYTAIEYYKMALDIFERNEKWKMESAVCYNNIASSSGHLCNYDTAIMYYFKAINIFKSDENKLSSLAICYNNLGHIYFGQRDYINALECFNNSLDIYKKIENTFKMAVCYNNIGLMYINMGDYDRALAYYGEALAIYKKTGGENRDLAACYNNIASIYEAKGDYDNAIENCKNALDILMKTSGRSDDVAACCDSIGSVYVKKAEYDIAATYFKKAISVYEEQGMEFLGLATAYNNLASTYSNTGKYELAIVYYRKALDIHEKILGGNITYYTNLGIAYYLNNNHDQAIKYYKKAADMAKEASVDYESILTLANCAIIYSNLSDKKFKQEILDTCIKEIENARLDMSSMKTEIMKQSLPLYYYGVHFEAEKKDFSRAFEYSEALRSRGFLDQIGTFAATRLDGITEIDKKNVQELTRQITASRQIISSQSSIELEKRDTEFFLAEEKKLHDAEKKLSQLDSYLSSKNPKYASLRNPKTATLKDAQKWCGKKRAVLEYVIWDESFLKDGFDAPNIGSYCIVITEKKIDVVALDGDYEYEDDLDAIQNSIDNGVELGLGGRFERRQKALYEFLIAPVEKHLKNIEEIVIVPDGKLFKLPFDLLKKDADSAILGDLYAISLSPSVSVSIVANEIKNKSEKMLAIGAAWYDSRLSENEHRKVFYGDESFVSEYLERDRYYPKDLPGDAKEIRVLQERNSKEKFDVVVQERATEREIKSLSEKGELKKYSTLLFSGHGEFDSENPGKSGILFSEVCGKFPVEEAGDDADSNILIDGYLRIEEVSLLNLNANMFVLSACETGLGEVKNGDGFTGLVRAFMVAGCKNVGASLWKVNDAATAEFMMRIFENVKNGMSYAASYKKVKAEFRAEGEWSKPCYWAAFVLWE